MNRRNFLGGVSMGGAMYATGVSYAAEQNRPNIVLLLTDDQSYRSLGFYGNAQAQTPNLDALAAQGLVFDRAYDTTAICMASRAQVMTGMYEYKTGCNFSHGPLTADKWAKSYPVVMREAGYHTGFIGKFGFAVREGEGNSDYHSNEDLPLDSFDEWYGWPGQGSYKTADNEFVAGYASTYPHVTRAVGAAAQDFIKGARKRNKPFCLSVSFKTSHGPMSPDPFFDDVYADTRWTEPPNYDEAGAAHLPEQAKSGRQYLQIKDFAPGSYQKTMRKYNQLVHGMDYAVGMIRGELKRQGLAENTVILYLTDNGYSCGAHGMGGKVLPYEEASRTPMIICDPRRPNPGQRCNAVVGNIDMAPTVLDFAGLPIPGNMDGKSLRPLLENPSGHVRDALLLINDWGNAPTHSLTVVTEEFKYIHWPYAEGMPPADELYQLTNDRYEMKNLAGNPEKQEVLQRLQKRYGELLGVWQAECVPESGYPMFGKIFDRNLTWAEKIEAMDARTRRAYLEWRTTESDLSEDGGKKPVSDEKKAAKAAERARRKAEQENPNK